MIPRIGPSWSPFLGYFFPSPIANPMSGFDLLEALNNFQGFPPVRVILRFVPYIPLLANIEDRLNLNKMHTIGKLFERAFF